jgi:hypothetical protein
MWKFGISGRFNVAEFMGLLEEIKHICGKEVNSHCVIKHRTERRSWVVSILILFRRFLI